MNCAHARQVLDAYVDGELDTATTAQLTAHLASCPACAAVHAGRGALRSRVRAGAPRYAAPAALRARVGAFNGSGSAGGRRRAAQPGWLMAGTLAGAAAVAGLVAGLWLAQPASDGVLHDDVVASHVASLADARRLTAIASDDRHAIKPWFQGKVDFTPAVRNLSDDGFTLLGARLDHVGGRQAAALVYRIRNHVINVFVWRADDAREAAPVTAVARGFAVTGWVDGGLHYAAISDVDPRELDRLARLLRGEP